MIEPITPERLAELLSEHRDHRDWPAEYRKETGLPDQCFPPGFSITSQTAHCLTYCLAAALADREAVARALAERDESPEVDLAAQDDLPDGPTYGFRP